MHSIGILAGGTACADLLAQALPPGLWERCRPACAGGMYDLLVVAPDWPDGAWSLRRRPCGALRGRSRSWSWPGRA